MALVPISTTALSWAIETSGIPKEHLDAYCQFPPGTIDGWLAGKAQPNQTQFKKLASKLKRQPVVFFMEDLPPTSEAIVELRSTVDTGSKNLSPQARHSIRDAIRVQKFVRLIQEELGNESAFPANHSSTEDPEQVANLLRQKYFDVSLDTQKSWPSAAQAFRNWRTLVEQLGVLVFLYSIGLDPYWKDLPDREAAEKELVRGFSIVSGTPPVIGISTTWTAEVRIYTLFHELAHILTRSNSACSETFDERATKKPNDHLERWCEQFAACFLMPRKDFIQFNTTLTERDPIERAGKIASKLYVSRKAALIRLIEIDEATWDDFRRLDIRFDRKRKGAGFASTTKQTRAHNRKQEYGNCLSLVREAYDAEVIDEHNVREYLRVLPEELV